MLKAKNALPLKSYDYNSSCSCYMGAVIVLLICQFLASVISIVVAVVTTILNGSENAVSIASSGDFNGVFMIFMQVATALFVLAFSKIRKYKLNFDYFRHEQTKKPPTVLDYILPIVAAVVLMCAMHLPTYWYGYLGYVFGFDESAGSLAVDTVSSVVMLVMATVFFAPIAEETIYRGVLFHGLASERKPIKAVMLSALSFMLMHMSPLQTVYQFSLGVLAAFIVYRSKKLLPAILLHSASNALALIVQFTPLSAAIGGCLVWLEAHVAAAFFITLGFFAVGGALLFVIVYFGFGYSRKPKTEKTGNIGAETQAQAANAVEMPAPEQPAVACDAASTQSQDGAPVAADGEQTPVAAVVTPVSKRSKTYVGTLKYWLTIGICGFMFLVNLIFLAI